jgi:hypothetical protein
MTGFQELLARLDAIENKLKQITWYKNNFLLK